MMKIHTTQNLDSLVHNSQPTDDVSSKDFRLKIYSEQMPKPEEPASADFYSSSVSFGKKPTAKDAKKIIKRAKKAVGDISKEPHPEVKGGDKFIEQSFFNWVLSNYRYEPVIQAAAAAGICMALRPATIMSLPAKGKSKEDNTYAASHSFASGIMGLVSAIIITAPFKKGGNYVMDVMRQHFAPAELKKLYPHLDIKSIWLDEANNIRRPIEDWLDKEGNKFVDSKDKIQYLDQFKQLADVSDLTYKDVLKLDVDWASQRGKSFNDVVLKDGSKLYDKINMQNIGIVVKEDGFADTQILLQDIDKEYLNNLIKDSKGTHWGNLDINSVYNEKGAVKDFREWKDLNGDSWKLDLDEAYISSPIEEITRLPRVSGRKRFDPYSNEYKFVSYQDNGKDGKLGTPIDETMVRAFTQNEFKTKLLTWGPDIATRIPVAMATVALIPWTLKNVFGLEKKSKKKKEAKPAVNQNTEKVSDKVSFKGKADNNKANFIIRAIAKFYGKPIILSDRIARWADKLSQSENLTQHMMALGSLITSSMYMTRTLQNKDLDPERKKTLAVNQGLCFVIPTVAAYTVDKILKDKIKKFEYRVAAKMQYAKDYAKYSNTPEPKFAKNLKNRGGVRILSSIGIFALTYRYLTPVIVTPIANWISDKFFTNDNQEEKEIAKEVKLDTTVSNTEDENVAKKVMLNSNDNNQIRKSA